MARPGATLPSHARAMRADAHPRELLFGGDPDGRVSLFEARVETARYYAPVAAAVAAPPSLPRTAK